MGMTQADIASLIKAKDLICEQIEAAKLVAHQQYSINGATAFIALVVGHELMHPGAFARSPIGAYEYDYNKDLAVLCQAIAQARGHTCRIFTRDSIGINGAYADVNSWFMTHGYNNCFAIELHFNSSDNSDARGSELLMCDSSDVATNHEAEFAQIVLDNMCLALGTKKRSVKNLASTPDERGWRNVNIVTKAPSVLIEPFFGSNDLDCEVGYQHKGDLAKSLVISCEAFIERFKSAITSGAI